MSAALKTMPGQEFLVGWRALEMRSGRSRAWLWERMMKEDFPMPFKMNLGGKEMNAWKLAAVETWLRSRGYDQ